jgi:CzcA family heavy metal efflux pump
LNPGRIALSHAKLILFLAAVLAALGAYAYTIAPQSMFPTMSFSRIDVVAETSDLPPDQVYTAVTRPLEAALQSLPSVVRVRGTASQGSAELIVEFDPKTDPRADLQSVDQALVQARAAVPAAASLTAVIVNPNSEPVVSYALTSRTLSQAVLRRFALSRLVPQLYGTPGLSRVLLVGGPAVEFHVDLDPAALGAVRLSAQDVAGAIAAANTVQSVGSGVTHYQRFVFLIDASPQDAASIARIPVPLADGSTIPLSSLGTVRSGVEPMTNQASYDARHCVILNAYVLPGANSVLMANAFEQRLEGIARGLAPTISVSKYWDQTRLITDSQKSLRDAILLGALLAVLVIYAFLRNLRMTLVAAAIIPLAMSIAVLILERSGNTLNLMSVGGLAVAVGLIIDDAIVVIENIAHHLGEAAPAERDAIIATGVGQLARPMLASTLTTVVVFAPLSLLGGVTGYFFRAFAFTLGASLIVSLALALFVTPILASLLLRRAESVTAKSRPDALLSFYEPILRWALGHRALVGACSAGILAVTVVLLVSLPSDFLPSMNEGQFEVRYAMPPGVSLAASDSAATTMERIVMHDPDVTAEGRVTGIDTNGFSPTQQNTGTLRVELRPGAPYEAVSSRLRDAIAAAVPAATLDFHQILEDQVNDLSGAPSPIEIALTGTDQQRLIGLAERLTHKIAKVRGIVDPFDGVVYDDPAIRIAPSATQLASLGLQTSDVASALSSHAQGIVATEIPREPQAIPVRVRVAGDRLGADDARSAPLFTKSGAPALDALAAVGRPRLASEINDQNGQRLVRVTANIGGASLSSVVAGIKAQIASLGLPGYSATIGGAYRAQQQSFRDFFAVFAVAVTLVFTVMLANFGSARLPLVILTAIPLALIGVALALAITRTPFNVSSFMGLLLLIGIVVKNGILLIDVANKRQLAGDDVTDALVAAGKERLRPIVMTTLAAIGGLLPVALGTGSGSEMQKPLAIAVIGGLSTATIFTLLVIPVLYAAFRGKQPVAANLPVGLCTVAALALVLAPRAASAQGPGVPNVPETPTAFAGLSLEDAERAALANSPDIAQAAGTLEFARAGLAQARAANGLAANLAYAEAPQGATNAQIASRITSSTLQLTLGDLLAYGPAVSSALASERSAEADVAAAGRAERIRTIGLYFAALKARAVAAARESALALARAQLDAANKRFHAGDAPYLDVLRAQVQVARAQADLALAKASDANASDALQRETGTASLPPVASEPVPQAPAATLAPQTAVAAAEQARSDLRSAREAVLAAQASVNAARRAAFPALTLSGGYNTGVDSGTKIAGPTLGLQLSLPLSAPARGKVEAQRALLAQARAKVASLTRALDLEVAAAARNAAASVEAERASGDALRFARDELNATDLGYRNGASSSLEVSVARSAYEQSLLDALSTTYDRVAAQATLTAEIMQ